MHSFLKGLWAAKANGHATNNNGAGSNSNGKAATTGDHHCAEHGVGFRRYEKEGRAWYAHKAGGEWCRERA